MGRSTKQQTATDATATDALEPVEYATPYDELDEFADVVIEVGPRVQVRKNKVQEVEPVRLTVMTKYGYELMDRDEDTGDTKHIPTKAIGTPKYVTVDDKSIAGGKRQDMIVVLFEVPYPAPKAEVDEADDETDEPEA